VFQVQAEPYDDERRRRCCGGSRHVQLNHRFGWCHVVSAVLFGLGIGAVAWFIHDAKDPR
jgi:hypothetical protein